MNFSRKFGLCAIAALLVAAPAAAADLMPYESGYLPEQYRSGPVGIYGPDAGYGSYGAVPYDCDPNSADGSQGLCVLGHPYPVPVLPNARYGWYPYQGGYGSSSPPTGPADRYDENPDQRGYRPFVSPSDRYGQYSGQPGPQPGRPLPEIAPDGYSGQRDYGSDNEAYSNYPHSGDASAQSGYRSATSPIPRDENPDPEAYGQDRPPPYAGYPAQRGYEHAAPIGPGDHTRRAYEPGSQPSAALPSEAPYDRYSY